MAVYYLLDCPCQSTRGEGGSRALSTWTKWIDCCEAQRIKSHPYLGVALRRRMPPHCAINPSVLLKQENPDFLQFPRQNSSSGQLKTVGRCWPLLATGIGRQFSSKTYRKSSHRAEKVEQEKTALWEIRPMRGIEKFYKYFEIRGWRP